MIKFKELLKKLFLIKLSPVKDCETFKNYVILKNKKCVFYIFLSIFLILIIFQGVNFFCPKFIKLFPLILGIFGTILIGFSSINSSKSIIDLSASCFDYSVLKADNFLFSKLLVGLGTVMLLISIILQFYIVN